jgi:hypothetical protein
LHFKASGKFLNRFIQKRLDNFPLKSNLIKYKKLLIDFYYKFKARENLLQQDKKPFIFVVKLNNMIKASKILKHKPSFLKILMAIIKELAWLLVAKKYCFVLEKSNVKFLSFKTFSIKNLNNFKLLSKSLKTLKFHSLFQLYNRISKHTGLLTVNKYRNGLLQSGVSVITKFDTKEKIVKDVFTIGKFFKNMIKYYFFFKNFRNLFLSCSNKKFIIMLLKLFKVFAQSNVNLKKFFFSGFFVNKLHFFKKYKIFSDSLLKKISARQLKIIRSNKKDE